MVSIPSTQFSLVDVTSNHESDLEANANPNLSSLMVSIKRSTFERNTVPLITDLNIKPYPMHIRNKYTLKTIPETDDTNIISNSDAKFKHYVFIRKTVLIVSALGCIYYFWNRSNV